MVCDPGAGFILTDIFTQWLTKMKGVKTEYPLPGVVLMVPELGLLEALDDSNSTNEQSSYFYQNGASAAIATLSMNLTKPIQYSFLGLQGMTSKVYIVPKNREYQKSAPFESLWALFERKSYKKVPRWHNFPKKITLRACGKCHVWPILARFLPIICHIENCWLDDQSLVMYTRLC